MSSELESDVCYRVYGWRHLVKATEVTAGLAGSYGSLLPGGWLKVTCGLTVGTLDPTLGNEYGITLPFSFSYQLPVCYIVCSCVLRLISLSIFEKADFRRVAPKIGCYDNVIREAAKAKAISKNIVAITRAF